METNEIRYYRVTVKNIAEHTDRIKDFIYVVAEEHNGNYVDILTNKKIYFSNEKVFNARDFIKSKASLYGIEKLETTRRQVATGLLFTTESSKYEYINDVMEMEKITLNEAMIRHYDLVQLEQRFIEEHNSKKLSK